MYYAAVRGIKVIPEIEGPAHLNSLGLYNDFRDLIGCFDSPSSSR